MAGGKGKSTGGKAGPKDTAGKSQKSHSAKAGLQVRWMASLHDSFTFVLQSIERMPMASPARQSKQHHPNRHLRSEA